MREIKFRVWDGSHMNDVAKTNYVDKTGFVDRSESHESNVWLQYAGVRDMRGVEIYEGDLLKQRYSSDKVYEVVWRKHGFELKYEFTRQYDGDSWKEQSYAPIHRDSYEVIGNIYANPELLNQ